MRIPKLMFLGTILAAQLLNNARAQVPVVNWFQPTNGATFAAGSGILLRAIASDSDGTLTSIEFLTGTNLLGRVSGALTNGTYSVMWSNAPAGTHSLHAEAVAGAGARGVSASVLIIVTNTVQPNALPVVNVTNPTNGTVVTVGTPVLLTATATDADGSVSYLDFYSGSSVLGRATGPSTNGLYSWAWTNAQAGMYFVHAEAVDDRGGRGVSASIQIAVSGITNGGGTNVPPTLNPLPFLTVSEDAPNQTVVLSGISSGDASENQTLTITATSSSPSLIPNPVINYTSPNTTGTLLFKPATNAFGIATIMVVVNDGQPSQNIVTRSFNVTVTPVNDLPTISGIASRTIQQNTSTGPIPFTVRDVETPASDLVVSGFSSNLTLVPSSNLVFGGSGTNRTVTVVPASDQTGTATITLMVQDTAGGTGSRVFSVTVNQGGTNAPPTNNALPVVTWIRPANGAVLEPGIPALLKVNATDSDGTISYVDFYLGSNYLSRGIKVPTNSQYNLTWSNPPAGVFQLHAEAVDNAGGRGISTAVQVFVGASGAVDLGTVEVATIGHQFFHDDFPPSPGGPDAVLDFLIDQDQSSGGGGVLRSASVNWDTNIQFTLTVAAPPHMKFMVSVPPGAYVRFGGFLWWESTRGGFSPPGPVAVSFADLEGAAFDFSESDSVLSDSHGFFGFVDVESTGATNSFSFTSITLTGTVQPQYTGHGTEMYLPHLESSLFLSSSTTQTNDPGSFVSIVPSGPLPMARMVGVPKADGVDIMVYGQPGRTHIVECSTDTAVWTAISSRVMPPAGLMSVKDVSATTVGSRFYRVVELP